MLSCYIGYLSVIFLIYAIIYKKINKFIGNIKIAKLFKMHYIIGSIAVIFAITHSIMNMRRISITLGTISLVFMICSFGTGVLIKYFRKKKRNINIIVAMHISFSILSLVVIVFHIIQYYIFG